MCAKLIFSHNFCKGQNIFNLKQRNHDFYNKKVDKSNSTKQNLFFFYDINRLMSEIFSETSEFFSIMSKEIQDWA